MGQQNFRSQQGADGPLRRDRRGHALILFGLVYGSFYLTLTAAGTTDGLYIMGTTLNCRLTITVNLKVVQLTNMMTAWNAFAISSAVAACSSSSSATPSCLASRAGTSTASRRSSSRARPSGSWWCSLRSRYAKSVLALRLLPEKCFSVQAMLPDFVLSYLKFNYFPEVGPEAQGERRQAGRTPARARPDRSTSLDICRRAIRFRSKLCRAQRARRGVPAGCPRRLRLHHRPFPRRPATRLFGNLTRSGGVQATTGVAQHANLRHAPRAGGHLPHKVYADILAPSCATTRLRCSCALRDREARSEARGWAGRPSTGGKHTPPKEAISN